MASIKKSVFWVVAFIVWQKFTDVSWVLTSPIIRAIVLMMEAACAHETSINVY